MKKTLKKSKPASRSHSKASAKKYGNGRNIGIGAGILTAAALAGAAAYLLSGKKGKARRTNMKAWAVKAQKEIARKVKESKHLGEAQYKTIVDEAVRRYGSLEKVNVQELVAVAKDLKGDWEQFQGHAKAMAGMVKKNAAKVKKVVTAPRPATKRPARKAAKRSK